MPLCVKQQSTLYKVIYTASHDEDGNNNYIHWMSITLCSAGWQVRLGTYMPA